MLRRTKGFALAAAAAATVALIPGGATAAMATCQVKPLFSVVEYGQTVLIYGVYNAPKGAVDVELTCGVTRLGATHARATDRMVGPAAVVASSVSVPNGSVSSCHEITVTYLDGSTTYSDTCP